MATSGYADKAFSNRPAFFARVNVALNELDTVNNRSRWNWALRIHNPSNYTGTWSGDTTPWSVNIGGDTDSGTTPAGVYDFRDGASSHTVATGLTGWLNHGSDGSLTFNISATLGKTATGLYPFGTANPGPKGVSAPTIPRATQPSVSGSIYAGSVRTISLPRASSSFTHDLTYTFGEASGTIATGVGTTYDWTMPLALLNEIPNDLQGTGVITCKTYDGSTLIGTKTATFTCRADANIVPTIDTLSLSEAVTSPVDIAAVVGGYVQGQSKLDYTISGAAGVYGSTVTSYQLEVGAQVIDGASGTTEVLSVSGTVPVTARVTDSRGRQGTKVVNINVLAWAAPQITSFLIERSTGSTVDPDGTDLKVTISASVSSLVVGTQKNQLKYKTLTRQRGAPTWTQKGDVTHGSVTLSTSYVVSGPYAQAQSFDGRVEISDRFATSAAQTLISVAQVAMHFTTDGVAVGKYWERGKLDVAGDIYASGGVLNPVGEVTMFAGSTAPTGWLLCQGQAVSRSTYAALFAAIGTTYGSGNGSTTFNVPNLKGRVPVGMDAAQAEFNALGKTGGAKAHTLTAAEMPVHDHGVSGLSGTNRFVTTNRTTTFSDRQGPAAGSGVVVPGYNSTNGDAVGSAERTDNAGSGNAHNNLQPYIGLNFIIRAV